MLRDTPKRRLFKLLRRTARGAGLAGGGSSAEGDPHVVWLGHQRALAVAREATESTQRIASNVAKQRGAVEAVADRARAAAVRAQELSTSFARVVDAFERLGLVALNAGLEGARLGESVGRSLLLVSDEVRAQAARGGENARDLGAMLGEVGSELAQLNANLEQVRESSAEVSHEAARASAANAEVDRALLAMEPGLRKATASDPETMMAIAEAGEQARALMTSLASLSGKVPRALLVSALRPMLDPLSRVLEGDDAGEGDAEGRT
jgi:methyl-accepting chemotaxis protein